MAATDFTLYYFPGSYYSLKALYALYDKGVPFKEHVVFIHFGEQNEDWFRSLNPNGVVPALQDGDKMVVESEEIINYIDTRCPNGSPLVPDLGTKLGQEVDKYRRLLHDVKVDVISFGLLKNRQLCTSSIKLPPAMQKRFNKENIEKQMKETMAGYEAKIKSAKTNEERIYFEMKLNVTQRRNALTSDADQVSKVLDELERVMDEIEEQLKRTKQACPAGDYWLCGRAFTAADITATTLIQRLQLVGIDDRFFNAKRPLSCDYKKRLMARPTAQKIATAADGSFLLIRNKMLKNSAKRVLKAGLVIGLIGVGIYAYRKYFR